MACKCGSYKIISIQAKCDDRAYMSIQHVGGKDGYILPGFNIGRGDYIDFDYCGDCGLIQDFVPISDETIVKELGNN